MRGAGKPAPQLKESKMENKKFEVGKFYRVHLYPTYGCPGKGIPGMVVRKLKRKIVFEYLIRYGGELCKDTVERRLGTYRGVEDASATEMWNGIAITLATHVCAKPSNWDSVPSAAAKR